MFGFKEQAKIREQKRERLVKNYIFSVDKDLIASPIELSLNAENPETYLKNRRYHSALCHYIDKHHRTKLGRLRTFKNIIIEEISFYLTLADALHGRELIEFDNLDKRRKERLAPAMKWMEAWVDSKVKEDLAKLKSAKLARTTQTSKIDLKQLCPTEASLIAWLEDHGSNPALWHEIVLQTDPDGRDDLYAWIAGQTDCDKGTAIQIFHHSAGYEALGYRNEMALEKTSRSKMYQTAKRVADRISQGEFKAWQYAANDVGCFGNLQSHKKEEKRARKKFGKAIFSISPDLFDATPRTETKTNYFYSDFCNP